MISIITLTKHSKLKLIIVLLILLLAIGVVATLITAPKSSNNTPAKRDASVPAGHHIVTDVVDGDTIKVSIDDKIETIRFIGIDAPELPNDCFSRQATSKARKTLKGQPVRLETDKSQDNHDR